MRSTTLRLALHWLLHILLSVRADGECGGLIDAEVAPFGTILSPGYPDHYPEEVECLWTIQAPSGERVELAFNDFDLTGSADCSGDFVSFRTSSSDALEKRYCGSSAPPSVQSEGEFMNLILKSNREGSCRGFNASYQLLKETVTCGSHTKAMEFTFVSPNYPESISNGSMQCPITVSHGCNEEKQREICQMKLQFEEFQIQPPFWGDCKYDSFYVENASPLPILCGNNTENHMYIDVQGRSKTDLTFLLSTIEDRLYNCYDIYQTLPPIQQSGTRRRREASIDSMEINMFDDSKTSNSPGRFERQATGVPSTVAASTVVASTSVASIVAASSNLAPGTQSTILTSTKTATNPATTSEAATTTTTTQKPNTTLFPTVAIYNYGSHEITRFDTRRAWKIHVTQIPCTCPQQMTPKAPDGCLQYHTDVNGDIKSFNYESLGCYTEDRWCDFEAMKDDSECDIRVGYSGHLNNLDYSICVGPESGFCGVKYQQMGNEGFSMSNVSDYGNAQFQPLAEMGDDSCIADYLWIPGVDVENEDGVSAERFCGTQLGIGDNRDYISTYSKPFTMRVVTDSDEFRIGQDYMNRGYHLYYSQIPCKVAG